MTPYQQAIFRQYAALEDIALLITHFATTMRTLSSPSKYDTVELAGMVHVWIDRLEWR